MSNDRELIYSEVCRVTGRAAIMLLDSRQMISKANIRQLLCSHKEQEVDRFMSEVYEVAIDLMSNS
ncbi:DUF2767 family protein [Morganella psychrotolerans]|uniref:DUF2767 family protein n=1 Tax=Morganella psychrotolerans TaxID=368603 RepID=A0A5M9RA68_9GAMM|nr:DUF2767 family protein [Morganella psychrotolerans]KAA8717443.1 DUF2767 family protein [Morganella psychrotolerans]OBU08284.1 hypothetical protein AYY16_02765 [Morganella psychrotolerans]